MGSNWRTEVDAEDYFGHQKKKLDIADRRPLIRRGSGLGSNDRPSMVRKDPDADNGITNINPSAWTNLTLPTRLDSGLGSTFGIPNAHSISVLRPGLYIGSVTITLYGAASQFRVHGPAGTTPNTLINIRTIQTGDAESVSFALDVATGGATNTVIFSGRVNSGTSQSVATISDFWVTRIGPR